MSNYLIEAQSNFVVDEEELKDYIADRQREWGLDRPEEIERLKNTGMCILSDEAGNTKITVRRIEDD